MVSTWPTRNKNIYAENLMHNLNEVLNYKEMKRSKQARKR